MNDNERNRNKSQSDLDALKRQIQKANSLNQQLESREADIYKGVIRKVFNAVDNHVLSDLSDAGFMQYVDEVERISRLKFAYRHVDNKYFEDVIEWLFKEVQDCILVDTVRILIFLNFPVEREAEIEQLTKLVCKFGGELPFLYAQAN